MYKRFRVVAVVALSGIVLLACATSPTGRRQLQLFPEDQLTAMGTEAYREMKQQTPVIEDQEVIDYVTCVADAITEELGGEYAGTDWEVTVFRDEAVNAFALPGGKIGVYTGLLNVAENQHQLATVIGHEVAHVLAEHSNERLSTSYATAAGLTLIQVLAGGGSRDKQQALALLGLGAQVGIILPFSRTHESEADVLGLDLMARAGFDPQESVNLWQNMSEASGGKAPPEFLSTHPAHDTRIDNLKDRMPRAMGLYEKARMAGRRPDCQPPERIPEAGSGD